MAARQDEAAESEVTPQVRVGPAAGVGDSDDEDEEGRRVTRKRQRLRALR